MKVATTLVSAALASTSIFVDGASAQSPRPRITDFETLVIQMRLINSSLALHDANGDGIVSDLDVLLSVHNALAESPIIDRDHDGQVTAADTILAIRQYILTSMANPTGSGKPDTDDVFLVVGEAITDNPNVLLGDTTGDGTVNGDDVAMQIAALDAPEPEEIWFTDPTLPASQDIYNRLGWIDQVGVQQLMEFAASVHVMIISKNYDTHPSTQPPWQRHTMATSQAEWPANHYYSVSRHWKSDPAQPPTPGHTASTSARDWPPNHMVNLSRSWTVLPLNPHDSDFSRTIPSHGNLISQDGPVEHSVESSSLFNIHPNHTGSISRMWPFNHESDISRLWPSNHLPVVSASGNPLGPTHNASISALYPNDHAASQSATWPDSHLANISTTWPTHAVSLSTSWPPQHNRHFSGGWDHGIDFSRIFPPNHTIDISRTWGSHSWNASMTWPPTHGQAISGTWPPQPPLWPASHVKSVSESWTVPVPSWLDRNHIFPQGHTWYTTIKDVFPSLPLTNPRPPTKNEDPGDPSAPDNPGNGNPPNDPATPPGGDPQTFRGPGR